MTSVVSLVSSAGRVWRCRPSGVACHDHCCCCLRHGVEHSDSGSGSGDTHENSGLPDHTCNRLRKQCVELGCLVELGGTELVDEAPHRMASVGCSGGTYYWGSRSFVFESRNWMIHRPRVFAEVVGGVHVLCLNGLVHKDLECGKVMQV